jgi:hypothetical protein
MADDDRREERHRRIQTVLAAAKLVLWILWETLNPRHLL